MVSESVGLFVGWESVWLLCLLCGECIWLSAYLNRGKLYPADSMGGLEYPHLVFAVMVWDCGDWTCMDAVVCKIIFCSGFGSDFALFL